MKPSAKVPAPSPPPAAALRPLEIHTVARPLGLLVQMHGDAGVTAMEPLRHVVDRLIAKPPARLVVDLSGLAFIASLGLGQLVRLAVAVRNKGGLFRVCGAHPGITQAILKSKLNELMPVFRDLADADK